MTRPLVTRDRLLPLVPWVSLVLAIAILAIGMWTVLPPPTYLVFAFSIVAAEMSLHLLLISLAVLALAALPGPHARLRRVAIIIALVNCGLFLRPVLKVGETVRRSDIEMARAFGRTWMERIPPRVQERMRHHPLVLGDCIVGVHTLGSVTTTAVSLSAADGTALPMEIYQGDQPPLPGPQPIIVAIHGGGWQHGAATDDGACSRYLATQGYVVFSLSYRLAPQYRYPAQLDDVQLALDWIRAHAGAYDADATRIALLGRSAGAQLALVAAYRPQAHPVQAVVAFYTPVDLVDGYVSPPQPDPLKTVGLIRDYIGGTPDALMATYRAASPIDCVHGRLPPTLLLHGWRDHAIQYHSAWSLQQALLHNHSQSAFIVLPWSDHAFDIALRGLGGQVSLYYLERFLAWSLAAPPAPLRPAVTPAP